MISGATSPTPMIRTPPSSNSAAMPGKQPVVATAKHSGDPRHQPQHLPIGADLGQRRPQQRSDEHRLAAPLGAGKAKEAARLPDGYPVMGIAFHHFRVRPTAHAET